MQQNLSDQWVIDSGSEAHCCYTSSLFTSYTPYNTPSYYARGVGGEVPILGTGIVRITLSNGRSLLPNDVNYCENETKEDSNILSVSMVLDQGRYEAMFDMERCVIRGQREEVTGTRYEGLYWLDVEKLIAKTEKRTFKG
jgi:hypothetical protein